MPIRVLICDDSAVMRAMLSDIVGRQPDMEVVGTAADAAAAREMIRSHDPDVLTLDVEMPCMDGLDFLARLMRLRPMPVVMISSSTGHDSEAARRARELGAAQVLAKPRAQTAEALEAYATQVGERIRAAFHARAPAPQAAARPPASAQRGGALAPSSARAPAARGQAARIVVIGASTGGTEAIKEVLQALPATMPPILLVQHMPEIFTTSFARRLDGLCKLRVKEAEHGERIAAGTAYLAPGHSHLTLGRAAGGYQCELSQGEPVNRHRPSVDVLFRSAAGQVAAGSVGVLLTGMGKDGAQGLLELRQAGAWTIAQDRDSCVVYGMPREAAALGAACEVLPLHAIAARIVQQAGTVGVAGAG
jgi:two-component system chemotaxis response regulator CheB